MPGIDAIANLPHAADIAGTALGVTGTLGGTLEAVNMAADVADHLQGRKGGRTVLSHFLPGRSTPDTPPERQKTIARQNEALANGDPNLEINLDPRAKQAIIDRLTNRHRKALENQRSKPPTVIDKMVLRTGFLDSLKAGNLTAEDVALAWCELRVEQLSKQVAASAMIQRKPATFEGLRNSPLLGRFVGSSQTEIQNWIHPGGRPVTDAEFNGYVASLGYSTFGETEVIHDLENLDQLRIQLEKSFYRNGFRNPLIDRAVNAVRGRPLNRDIAYGAVREDALSKSGHEYYDSLNSGIQAEIAKRIEAGYITPGTTYIDLLNNDPLQAAHVEHAGIQYALSEKARTYALEIVKGEGYQADAAVIRQRATELRTPPTREELTALQEAKTKADVEAAEAQTKYDELKSEYDRLKLARTTKGLTQNAVRDFNATYVTGGGFGILEARIAGYDTTIASASDDTTKLRISELQAREVTELKKLRNDQYRLFREFATAESEYGTDEQTRLTAIGMPAQGATLATNEFLPLTTTLNDAKTAAKTATENHDTRSHALDAPASPETEKTAKAEDRWALVAEQRSKIHEIQYSQHHGDEFTIARLTDQSPTSDRQVAGAEAIRKLIFQTVDKKNFSPEIMELSRKMLSDEAIALAMLEYFRINLDTRITIPTPAGGTPPTTVTFRQQVDWINDAKQRHTAETNSDAKKVIAEEISNRQRYLASVTLGYPTNPHQMEIASFINFIIDRGLISAELGNPYLSMVR